MLNPVLDVSLEAKAVKFLEYVDPDDEDLADAYLGSFASSIDEYSIDYVQPIVVLTSSASQIITTAEMKMLTRLVENCSPKVRLALLHADLIPQLVSTLNPQSLSFAIAEDIHTCFLEIIINSVWLATPHGLSIQDNKDDYKRVGVHYTKHPSTSEHFELGLVEDEKLDRMEDGLLITRFLSLQRPRTLTPTSHSAPDSIESVLSLPTIACVSVLPVILKRWINSTNQHVDLDVPQPFRLSPQITHSPIQLHRRCSHTPCDPLQCLSVKWIVGVGRKERRQLLLTDVRSFVPTNDSWDPPRNLDQYHRQCQRGVHPSPRLRWPQRDRPVHSDIQQNHPRFGESHDQNYIITSHFSFPASVFVAFTVVVRDRIVHANRLDGDELRSFWTSWKVSELALNLSHSKSVVQQASGRLGFSLATARSVEANDRVGMDCGTARRCWHVNDLCAHSLLQRLVEADVIAQLHSALPQLSLSPADVPDIPVHLWITTCQSHLDKARTSKDSTATKPLPLMLHASTSKLISPLHRPSLFMICALTIILPSIPKPVLSMSSGPDKNQRRLDRDKTTPVAEPNSDAFGIRMTTIDKKADVDSSPTRSNLSSSQIQFSMPCSPFLNWDEKNKKSEVEKAVIFQSLIATIKLQPTFDDSLEAKAVKVLEYVTPDDQKSADAFLSRFGRNGDDYSAPFLQSLMVLITSARPVITTAAMKMLDSLIGRCSPNFHIHLVKADLIALLINTLYPQSITVTEAVDTNTSLLLSIAYSLWLATPRGLTRLGIEDRDEQQNVHETILKQVLVPSEKYICHLSTNRFSIVDGEQSYEFLELLARLLRICPYHQPTMDIVLRMPIFVTIPNCLTFFESDRSIWNFLDTMAYVRQERNEKDGELRLMGKTMDRMLRMEGFEDVIEEKLQNDEYGIKGRLLVISSIDLNKLLGMNIPLSSTDSIPSIGMLISSAQPVRHNTTILSLQHITQHSPERLPPHLELRELKPIDLGRAVTLASGGEMEIRAGAGMNVETTPVTLQIDQSLSNTRNDGSHMTVITSHFVSRRILLSVTRHAVRSVDETLLIQGASIPSSLLFLNSSPSPTTFCASDRFICQKGILPASMKVFDSLLANCSVDVRLVILNANLIPRINTSLHALSLSFAEQVDFNVGLVHIIKEIFSLATLHEPDRLLNEHPNEQRSIHRTVLEQILVPSEIYLRHLCEDHFSIVAGDGSKGHLLLLAQLHLVQAGIERELEMKLSSNLRDKETIQQLDMEVKKEKERTAQYENEMTTLRMTQTQPPLQPAPHSSGVRSNAALASSAARQETVGRTQIGAAAIEQLLFDQTDWTLSGNVFTKSRECYASLVSFEFGAVVARLSLTIRKGPSLWFTVGLISSKLSNEALTEYLPTLKGGAGWELHATCLYAMQNGFDTSYGYACLGGREGQRVVMEADEREGKRTLKLSQDGETQPVYFTNIPVPFRFAIHINNANDAVEIKSAEVVEKPQMDGETIAVAMDE
ncbi:hypothetical protein BLNAU_18024 [Blattamonas nauphoetae]|uniref:Uncharacterized protein n=1 Tax=Blattamonas nauphoetae TaxID=2049346 RepID=A0ABQ9X8M4_9EUKA|nr:hypothetical protein BLNAU_18024 [Blattamonas nauphoetae]